jgi:hypothetical protein
VKKQELVHRHDFLMAYTRFLEVQNDVYDFEDFIEAPMMLRRVCNDTHDYFDVSGHTLRQLDILLGPHYRTMIKAWLVT